MPLPQWQGKPSRWRPSWTHSCTERARHDRRGALVDADEVDAARAARRRSSIHGQASRSETAGGYATSGRAEGRRRCSDIVQPPGDCASPLAVPATTGFPGSRITAGSRLPAPGSGCWELALRSQWRDRAGLAPASPRHRLKCGRVYMAQPGSRGSGASCGGGRGASVRAWPGRRCSRGLACASGRAVADDRAALEAIRAEPEVLRWWGEPRRATSTRPRTATCSSSRSTGRSPAAIQYEEVTDPQLPQRGHRHLPRRGTGRGAASGARRSPCSSGTSSTCAAITASRSIPRPRTSARSAATRRSASPGRRPAPVRARRDGAWHDGLLLELVAAEHHAR